MNLMELFVKIGVDKSDFDKGLDSASGKATSFASKLGGGLKTAAKVGAAAIAAAGTAVTAFGVASVKVGMTFDASMSNVLAISGATAEEFELLRAKAEKMGASTKFSATEAADAMGYMAMAGWKTEDMLNGIEGIMNLAAASGENLAATSDIVTDALTAFGLSAKDSGHFADILAAASSNANTNVSMMGETFKYVAPVAGALGYTAEDTAVAIGLMANAGVKASQAGTTLRGLLTRLAKQPKEAAAAMNALNITLDDGEGNMYSFAEVMQQLRKGFSEDLMISTEEFTAALQELNAAGESGEITQKEYDAEVEKLIERAYGAEGAIKAEYAAMLAGQEGMSGLLAIVNASDDDFQKLTESIENCSNEIDGFNGTAAYMSNIMQDNLAGDVTKFKSALEGAQIAISDKLTPSLRDFVQFGSSGLSKITDAFKEGDLSGAMDAFGEVLSDGLTMVIDKLPDVIDAGVKLLDTFVGGILDNSDKIIDAAIQIIDIVGNSIVTNLPKLIDAGFEIIMKLADSLIENLPELVPAIVDIILTIIEKLTDPDMMVQMLDAAIQIILALCEGIINALPMLIERVPEIIINIVKALVEAAPLLWDAMVELFNMAMDMVKNIDWEQVGKDVIQFIVDGIRFVFVTIPNKLMEIGEKALDYFANIDWKEVGKKVIKFILDGIVFMFITIPNKVKEIGAKALSLFKSIDWKKLGKDVIQTILNGIIFMFYTIPKKLAEIGKNALDSFKNIDWLGLGKDVVSGIVKGIVDNAKKVISAITDMVKDAWKAVKDFFGIHSPSKKMAWIGEMLDAGLAGGISVNASEVKKAVDDLAAITEKPFGVNLSNGSIETGAGTSNNTVYITVYGAQGQDVNQLAEIIEERLSNSINRRGVGALA